jgi:hypothetical protein
MGTDSCPKNERQLANTCLPWHRGGITIVRRGPTLDATRRRLWCQEDSIQDKSDRPRGAFRTIPSFVTKCLTAS